MVIFNLVCSAYPGASLFRWQRGRLAMAYKGTTSILAAIITLSVATVGKGLTANRVEFEFHSGFYRVAFEYTLPALKELREAQVEFKSRKKAEEFYWKLLCGADFYIGNPGDIRYINKKPVPEPW